MKKLLLPLLVIASSVGHIAAADSPSHAAYMELPPEYRAWFRNPDGSCMAADTPIHTPHGPLAISELRPERDAIYFLAADGQVRTTHCFQAFATRRVTSLTVLRFDGGQLRLTPDHQVAADVAQAGCLHQFICDGGAATT